VTLGKVVLVDDHRLVAQALAVALQANGYVARVPAQLEPEALLADLDADRPDCVLLDLRLGMVGVSGLDLVAPMVRRGIAVVMLTSETDPLVLAVGVERGALGWLPKDADLDRVLDAVRVACRGESLVAATDRADLLARLAEHRRRVAAESSPFDRLTARENEVLDALMEGLSAEEIAERDVVSLTTVRTHIRSMLQKLGVHSQLAAVAKARRCGRLPDPDVARSS
jgi:DNA-binding NarL/FixJ family response regulator